MFRPSEECLAHLVDGLFHRIERITLAGQDAELNQFMERLRQAIDAAGLPQIAVLVVRRQPFHGHLVQGQRARLVGAQDGGRAECLDGRDAAGEHAMAGNAPGTHSQENRQDHGELLRQRGHGQRDASQKTLQPVPPRQAIDHHHQRAQGKP